MSLVVFPFKNEEPAVLAGNLAVAAKHERVAEVWGVAAAEGASLELAMEAARETTSAHGTQVRVFAQERIGRLRPGKGDGMNTAIRIGAERGFERIHFYDADITNFHEGWIDGAEHAADRGFEIVRHRFPRSSTDAMITWMITRPSLAMIFPGTVLPHLGQPLGGELLISGTVAQYLAADGFVATRSDWGIDTVITYATSVMGLPLYEHNIAEGKRHALYGSLDEIRTMLIECLDAAQSLRDRPGPRPDLPLHADPPARVPEDLKRTVGYDVDTTMRLLQRGWTGSEERLAEMLPGDLGFNTLVNRTRPHFRFMDAEAWEDTLGWLLDGFHLDDPAWEALSFRLWLMRVLAYTTEQAATGYNSAIEYLEGTISEYERRALEGSRGH